MSFYIIHFTHLKADKQKPYSRYETLIGMISEYNRKLAIEFEIVAKLIAQYSNKQKKNAQHRQIGK